MTKTPNNIPSCPMIVFWEVTSKCNSTCLHCFNNFERNSNDDLSYLDVLRIIDELREQGVLRIKFTGGEPFCREDFLDILLYTDTSGLEYIIYTNGRLIDDASIMKLASLKNLTCVRVSIDGMPRTNDLIRGEGAFLQSVEAVRKLRNESIPCEINYTINRLNYTELLALDKYVSSHQLDCKINIGFIKLSGSAIVNQELCFTDQEDLIKALEVVKQQIETSTNINNFNLLLPIYYDLFGDEFGCPAARLTAAIDNKGDIYPCGLFSGISNFNCGNIASGGLTKAWNNRVMKRFRMLTPPSKCKKCSYFRKQCTGACRANAYHTCNDLSGEDKNCFVYMFDVNKY